VLELETLAEALLEFKTADELTSMAAAATQTGSAVEIRMIRSPQEKPSHLLMDFLTNLLD